MKSTLQRGYTCSRGISCINQVRRPAALSFVPPIRSNYHTFHTARTTNFKTSSSKWNYVIGAGVGGLVWYLLADTRSCEEKKDEPLPQFTRAEVAQHKSKETGIWVIYKEGVYDITEFVDQHPGGLAKIMLGAGSNIDPFWHVYQQHQVPHIREMLEMYRIGELVEADRNLVVVPSADPYANDPWRVPEFSVSSQKPFNAEPPLEILANGMVTPNEYFFVRNHLPVPQVDPASYVLEICGEGIKEPIRLTLEDLKKFPKREVTAVIQCAGNRRSELTTVRPVKGLGWGAGAISNAVWGGVYLRDIFKAYGIDESTATFKHLQFEGLDKDITNASYGGSVPVDVFRNTEVVLAYEMNGRELPRDHGYPLRAVVPGVVGARNVKWLSKVILSPEESKAFWQTSDYKGFSPSVTWETVDYASAPAIQELPVQSAILLPKAGSTVDPLDSKITVKGYAWSGGGKGIVRVDVSIDGGKTWHVANLQRPEQERGKEWGWTQWQAKVPVEAESMDKGKLDIVCKAVDTSYNTQPDTVDHIWNFRGVLCNAWHHVNVDVTPGAPPAL